MATLYPYQLRAGSRIIVHGGTYAVESLRDSIVNSRTGVSDIAIDLVGEDWSFIVPRHQKVETA